MSYTAQQQQQLRVLLQASAMPRVLPPLVHLEFDILAGLANLGGFAHQMQDYHAHADTARPWSSSTTGINDQSMTHRSSQQLQLGERTRKTFIEISMSSCSGNRWLMSSATRRRSVRKGALPTITTVPAAQTRPACTGLKKSASIWQDQSRHDSVLEPE